MAQRRSWLVLLLAGGLVSCKEAEITSPYELNAADFAPPPGIVRADTVVLPFLPQRPNNTVYLAEKQFVAQVAVYNLSPQTFAGSFEIEVPPTIEIESIIPNPGYFDTTSTGGGMICIPILASAGRAQYALSYIKDSRPRTPPNGVLFNLICRPVQAGVGFIRFTPTPFVIKTLSAGARVGSQTPQQTIRLNQDSLRIVVLESLD